MVEPSEREFLNLHSGDGTPAGESARKGIQAECERIRRKAEAEADPAAGAADAGDDEEHPLDAAARVIQDAVVAVAPLLGRCDPADSGPHFQRVLAVARAISHLARAGEELAGVRWCWHA